MRTRGLRMRWAGMALVALAVVIGTPVAVSFFSDPLWIPASRPPGLVMSERWRLLDQGGIEWHRHDNVKYLYVHFPTGSPWRIAWKRTPTYTHISVPVWPLPAVAAILGVALWWRGVRRMREGLNLPRARRWRCLSGLATVWLGLTFAALVAASFAFPGGMSHSWYRVFIVDRSAHRLDATEVDVDRGCVAVSHTSHDPANPRFAPRQRPSPFMLGRMTFADGWWFSIPFWPVALILLSVGAVALWRNERALLRACRGGCPNCGYPIDTVPGGVCPECGV